MTQEKILNLPPSWIWRNAIPEVLCDLVLREKDSTDGVEGRTGDGGVLSSLRDSTLWFLPPNSIIEGALYNHALYANEAAGWCFQMGRPEQVQVAQYGEGQHYGWHTDWSPLAITPNVRKITVVTLLNDASDFDGGQLEIAGAEPIELQRGDVIAFPSYLQHRVTPVTRGVRLSATCWVNGPRTH